MTLRVEQVGAAHAEEVRRVVLAAFGDRPPLDPPAPALTESVDELAGLLSAGGGLLVRDPSGEAVGTLVLDPTEAGVLYLRRVGVLPRSRHHGIATTLVDAAVEHAREIGCSELRVLARSELPATVAFWERHGFTHVGEQPPYRELARPAGARVAVPDAEAMRELGERVAGLLRAGDLVILSGDLGAGKTTMTQGIGAGLRVRGQVTSPTFVIARVHPTLDRGTGGGTGGGPDLVHVDAYRLGGMAELDDLDLDTDLDDAVTVVEWGEGLAETLAEDRLEVQVLRRPGGSPGGGEADDPEEGLSGPEGRTVVLAPLGRRWLGVPLLDG